MYLHITESCLLIVKVDWCVVFNLSPSLPIAQVLLSLWHEDTTSSSCSLLSHFPTHVIKSTHDYVSWPLFFTDKGKKLSPEIPRCLTCIREVFRKCILRSLGFVWNLFCFLRDILQNYIILRFIEAMIPTLGIKVWKAQKPEPKTAGADGAATHGKEINHYFPD